MASKTNNDNEPLWLGDQLPTMYDVATIVFLPGSKFADDLSASSPFFIRGPSTDSRTLC